MLIPNDRMDVQCLMEAMDRYIEAKAKHDKSRDEYVNSGGISWGYWGRSLIDRMDQLADDFGRRLDKYVDERVEAALAKRTPPLP